MPEPSEEVEFNSSNRKQAHFDLGELSGKSAEPYKSQPVVPRLNLGKVLNLDQVLPMSTEHAAKIEENHNISGDTG